MKYVISMFVLCLAFASTSFAQAAFDFDGDNKTDISIYRVDTGEWWWINSSDNTWSAFQFGTSTDIIVPADYTGDGKTDPAVFRPSTGEWFISRSEDRSYYGLQFGIAGDVLRPADYDGDGKDDIAVYRPSNGTWYILNSTGGIRYVKFGLECEETNPLFCDRPIPNDYDGDGKADISIFRHGQWWILQSTGGLRYEEYGFTGTAMPGDYDGDGITDIAYHIQNRGEWFWIRSTTGGPDFFPTPTTDGGKYLARGDYDGDGKLDPSTFDPNTVFENWYNRTSNNGGFRSLRFGTRKFGDIPVASSYISFYNRPNLP